MSNKEQNINRREMLRLTAGASLWAISPLLGCASQEGDSSQEADDESVDSGGSTDGNSLGQQWATGGTAGIDQSASYPDPFTDLSTDCSLIAATTLGPCTVQEEFERQDISEGWEGLPLRLGLRICDQSCEPIVGAIVKVWHTSHSGSYSGQTPRNDMCLMDLDFADQNFFRGQQITDARGIVFFDTCFPGQYPGRVIHIHFQVLRDGSALFASQLFFPEDIVNDICDNHESYREFGRPNVDFNTDGVLNNISSSALDKLILTVEKMDDGVMLASKSLTIV